MYNESGRFRRIFCIVFIQSIVFFIDGTAFLAESRL